MRQQHLSQLVRVEEQRNESLGQQPGLIYGTVVGTTGAFTAPGAAPAPAQNPVCNYQGVTITPARTGAGLYTLTITNTTSAVAQNLPQTEYKVTGACIGGAANANWNYTIATNVISIRTAVAAVATDEDFWFQIEPITG
jgi:hypothetical protein